MIKGNIGYYIQFYSNIANGEYQLNIEEIPKLLNNYPEDWMLWYILGHTYYQMGEYLDAIDAFKSAVYLNEGFYMGRFFLEHSVLLYIAKFLDNRIINVDEFNDIINFLGENLTDESMTIEEISSKPFGFVDMKRLPPDFIKLFTSFPESFIYGGISMVNLLKSMKLVVHGQFDAAVDVIKVGVLYGHYALLKTQDENYKELMDTFLQLFFEIIKITLNSQVESGDQDLSMYRDTVLEKLVNLLNNLAIS